MSTSFIVICSLVLIFVVAYISGSPTEGFEEKEDTLIIAKANWCPHCKKAISVFEKLAQESPIQTKKRKVNVRILDDNVNAKEISSLGIQGFPSIMLLDKNGKKEEYSGPRTYEGILEFVSK